MAEDPGAGRPCAAGGGPLSTSDRALRELAKLHGVQLSYIDAGDRRRRATPEALIAVLRALGAPLERTEDAPGALRARREELEGRRLEPVVVAWDGEPTTVHVAGTGRLRCRLDVEGEAPVHWEIAAPAELRLPELPLGYHTLRCAQPSDGEAGARALVVSAPRRAPALDRPGWGVFAPVHALRSQGSLGIGDLADLDRLLGWVAGLGGDLVATLPLLAAFTDEPFEPSPYAPASRLFWNELYVDPRQAPELEGCAEARDLLASPAFREEAGRLDTADLVDYRAAARLRRRLLEPLARAFFSEADDARRDTLERLTAERPSVEDYAAFRAATEERGPWPEWSPDERPRRPDASDERVRYHLYAQLLAHEQLAGLARRAEDSGTGLYFDLPLGVHPAGYDVWRHPEAFARGVSGGAPPDTFFTSGQDWGFQPPHPEGLRESGYAYLRACLRHLLRHARVLRVDHVMGLHRLFWIPPGMEAAEGVYVRYRPEEWYAILALEAHRHGAVVVGEDLGTVPAAVRQAMRRHGVHRSHVLQLEASAPEELLPDPPPDAFASHNTHDLPPFAAWWAGDDIDLRERHGAITPEEAGAERRERRTLRGALAAELGRRGRLPDDATGEDERAVFDGTLDHLASSEAQMVVVTLEDLWGERRQQNVPGTTDEHPNWRGRLAVSLEGLHEHEEVLGRLGRVDALRKGRPMTKSDGRKTDTKDAVYYDASPLTEDDLHLFNEGTHAHLHHKLGAHVLERKGVEGTHFAVWAPDAARITVFGDFNDWDKESHELHPRGGSGIWEGFVPGIGKGTLYKYHLRSRFDGYSVDKTDPFAAFHEIPPKMASIVWPLDYEWGDGEWVASRRERNDLSAPMSVYEMHVGSWMHADADESFSYRDLAPRLADYLERMGFTHVEFLPVMEHPFYGSWGYQTTGYFAPTSRFGTPEDFAFLVDHLHQRGLGVILDWVPSHFPTDEFALGFFDGTHLYEHADPRKGIHPDWSSYIFNYGRREVRSFLISSANHWLATYHADGLRVDAVASMLYLDYSRKEGEWIPNEHGGRENLEAISFLRQLNESVYKEHPDTQTIAEESTSWPSVSRPTYVGGLGFGMKWDMGWMHDTLEYFQRDPVHRKYHHNNLTFRMVYAFHENFCLPLSHDEVVHGKGSMLGKMPGDDWQRLANLRALYGYMWASPAKKLLFMGSELAQWREWDHNDQLDWHLLEHAPHEGVRRWVADLNRVYREEPALHELDCDPAGFEWVDANDSEGSTLTFLRRAREGETVLCCFNFTPTPRQSYRVGVPGGAWWRELLNSDAEHYGGSGQGNMGGVESLPVPLHGRPRSLTITLPPLACVLFKATDEPPPDADASSGAP